MKSRRRIGFPKTHDRVSMSSQRKRSNQKFAPTEMGSMVCLRSSNLAPRMSFEGPKAERLAATIFRLGYSLERTSLMRSGTSGLCQLLP
jgi:hypothetical protein